MTEATYYNHGEVAVTESRLRIGNTTYFINNITSVKTKETRKLKKIYTKMLQKNVAFFVGVVAVMIFLIGLFTNVPEMIEPFSFVTNSASLILGTIAFILWYTSSKSKWVHEYHLVISSSAGEKDALTSENSEIIRDIAKAINQAKAGQK